MISINSINPFPITNFPLQTKPVESASTDTGNEVIGSGEQILTNPLDTFVMNQLPEGPVNEMTDILRHIETVALQSAELEQTFENTELLQAEITEDISNLETVLSEFSQDDLKLFAAVFQNQAVIGPAIFDTNQSGVNADLFENQGAGEFLENLLRIDITSQPGLLEALDITDNIISLLSLRNFGVGFLESLLDSLTDFSLDFPDIGSLETSPENTTTQQDSGVTDRPAESVSISPESLQLKPSTIIDLVG
ncbi:MAG: hypothetical protein A2464_14670 [Deltaproteobacteria bacterium RIFOXYC2_FULL_48_10]|nr:MAG: hypothetical protein A2464_14670 [Deltaproteobacteria bacterium RIFOXYC2_FULL_48_10]